MRKHSNRPTMPTGHLHVQKIQNQGADLEKDKMDALILLVKKSISKGAESIQYTTSEIKHQMLNPKHKI